MAVHPGRVLVCCVAENRPRDAREVHLLFSSLLRFGGALAHCRKAALFVEGVDPGVAATLAAMGVETSVVSRVDPRCPTANKIRMFERADDIDWLVALDTDIAVAGDFSSHLRGTSVRAKPVDRDPLDPTAWQALFDRFDVAAPTGRYLTTMDHTETTAYFNTGVLLVPGALSGELAAVWSSLIGPVLDACRDIPALNPHRYFTDQFALTLALSRLGLDVDPLAPELNFPTPWAIHPAWQPDDVDPLLLHHHHRMTPGGTLRPGEHRLANVAIDRVNAWLTAAEEERAS